MDVTIEPHGGGLGDLLIYSWLPELYARAGHTVYFSNRTIPRNPGTRALLIEQNPFIAGFRDNGPIAYGVTDVPKGFPHEAKRRPNGLQAVNACHGFETDARFPKIYYQPKWRPEFRDTVFADPRSISQPSKPEVFEPFVREVARYRAFDPARVVVLRSDPEVASSGAGILAQCSRYVVRDIFEYCDLIFSCRLFLTTESGSQSLASAIKRESPWPIIASQVSTAMWNDRFFLYDNVQYWVSGQLAPSDYSGYGV